jgi:hypothetical protein
MVELCTYVTVFALRIDTEQIISVILKSGKLTCHKQVISSGGSGMVFSPKFLKLSHCQSCDSLCDAGQWCFLLIALN